MVEYTLYLRQYQNNLKGGDIMHDYMYQYRGDIERIVVNQDRLEAWQYVKGLYDTGLIDLIEWNTLSEYSKTFGEK